LAAQLVSMKGSLYKIVTNPKKLSKGISSTKRCYGLIRNKKFKYYKDRTMKDLAGVFDFDRINCFVTIDDGTSGNDSKGNSPIKSNGSYTDPKRFRIEVIGMKK
jgi:hypothetical protein